MNIRDKVILVTGGANGIGRGLCERFHKEGAKKVIVTDIDRGTAETVAASVNGIAYELDVADETQVNSVVADVLAKFGRIDLVCSNAGIGGDEGCLEVANESWQRIYEVNVLSHVYLARAVFPSMIERGGGAFMMTASAAGLLTLPTAAPYAVTKHGAVALAEYFSFAYREQGIEVFCLCPQGVKTDLISTPEGEPESFLMAGAITVEECAESVIRGLESGNFLILPHPEVGQYIVNKASDYERWLRHVAKMRREILTARER
jgi:NAD(P)-dependent dehydrogenase (short-subunit alcohol dehydrogenase family)